MSDKLRQQIRCTLGYCEASEHKDCLYESTRNETQELDLIMQLFAAHLQAAVQSAREDENLACQKIIKSKWGTNDQLWDMEERLQHLKKGTRDE